LGIKKGKKAETDLERLKNKTERKKEYMNTFLSGVDQPPPGATTPFRGGKKKKNTL